MNDFFNKKENYNPNSTENFKDYFPSLINKIIENNFKNFAIMPDFDKSKPVDYETIASEDLKPWFFSFDILEGKITNPKSLERIEQSQKKANCDDFSKAVYTGTDAKNTVECIQNIKKISYVLSSSNFKGIIKMIRFPKTRISEKGDQKPHLLKNYISKVTINDITLQLLPGLNTIIGRRGSGKSYLINSLIKKIQPNFIPKNKKKYTEKIKLEGNYKKEKVIYFEQSKLSKNLSSFINKIAEEKQKDFNLIEYIYKKEYNRLNFVDPIIKFISDQNSIKTIFKNILETQYEIMKNKYKKNINTYKIQILNKFKKIINKHQNSNAIENIEKDKKAIITLLNLNNDISKWTKFKLDKIVSELKKLEKNNKYMRNNELANFLTNLESKEYEKINSDEDKIFKDLDYYLNKLKNIKMNDNCKKVYKIIDSILLFKKNVNNGLAYSHKDEKVLINDLSFFTYDNKITEILLDTKSDNDLIWKFLGFALKQKDMTKKEKISSNQTIIEIIKIDTIKKLNGEPINNLSQGQKHEKFMENILKIENSDIIILDQPDDDLDAQTVQESLINKFTKNFSDKQWIVVTHDPKIVINSDSRKIIRANFDNNKNTPYYEVSDDNIKNESYKILDAKKEYPYIRGKKYQEWKW